MKTLSIIVPLYRESHETVDKAIVAMKNLQYPDKEVIFVFEPEESHFVQFVRSRGFDAILTDGENKSKANSLNVGFKHSTGDIIALYDADTEPEPEQALKAIRALEEGYDVVSGYILAATDTFLQKMRAIDLLDYCSALTVNSLPLLFGFSHYMRREVVEELGGWDGDTVVEDTDFSFKLQLFGYKVGIINSPIYSESSRGFKNMLLQRARWMKGGYQVVHKWFGHSSKLPFWQRIEFVIMKISQYGNLLSMPILLLLVYNLYLLLIGVRAYYLWILPLVFLVEYAIILFVITNRQLVKLNGVSIIDYLIYPIYRWVFWSLSVLVGFIELKRRPLYWHRTVRE